METSWAAISTGGTADVIAQKPTHNHGRMSDSFAFPLKLFLYYTFLTSCMHDFLTRTHTQAEIFLPLVAGAILLHVRLLKTPEKHPRAFPTQNPV